MGDDGGWGDLFAKASDIPTSNIVGGGNTSTKQAHQTTNKEKKHRKRKRQEDDRRRGRAQDEYQDLLASRMDSLSSSSKGHSATWPSWISLGRHLHQPDKCSKWEATEDGDLAKCQDCGESALHHATVVEKQLFSSSNKEEHSHLDVFTALRNIRCCAKFLMLPRQEQSNKICSQHASAKSLRNEFKRLMGLVPILRQQLPPEEFSLLISKIETIRLIQKQLKHDNKREAAFFCNCVNLIIACDAVYYRLYYLQLTQVLPIIQSSYCLPHPDQYFGLDFFTQNVHESRRAFLKMTKDIDDSCLVREFSGGNWLQERNTNDRHPLAQIWLYRYYETCSIFYSTGWMDRPQTLKSIQNLLKQQHASLKNFESKHETPAPSPLAEWRDSCRDFMCNLYAYATLSPKMVKDLTSFLQDRKLSVVEVGAGTGYIAKLLANAGVEIQAWDIHPTSAGFAAASGAGKISSMTMNDYHGATPAFCLVQKSASMPTVVDTKGDDKALLLCYPPPQSSMAADTLQTYLEAGGKCLIHIGEFKGLTGNSKFEQLLLKKMKCKYRSPCLSWGTDASHLTIWVTTKIHKKKNKHETSLLLPCMECKAKEAQFRCRLLRSLVYCSRACCEAHSEARKRWLRLHMIGSVTQYAGDDTAVDSNLFVSLG